MDLNTAAKASYIKLRAQGQPTSPGKLREGMEPNQRPRLHPHSASLEPLPLAGTAITAISGTVKPHPHTICDPQITCNLQTSNLDRVAFQVGAGL